MGGLFDLENKRKKVEELTKLTEEPDIWTKANNNEIMSELSDLKKTIETFTSLETRLNDLLELIDLGISEEEYNNELSELKKQLEKLKIEVQLNGEFDKNNAYMEIHSGAGGTESNDWANMIYRMYLRYFEKNNYKVTVLNTSPGETVGIKGVFLHIKGKNAYGYLKGETGVHRLVRISPFDSNKRRHTSFASVLITPEINTDIDINIEEKDLKIDVYHSGGAGGQSVNTTDSAVRITHLPTGIVVTCQNERSQLQNKAKALEILRSKLYILEKSKMDDKLKDLKGSIMDVNFGSQIRNYVMCPYNLVKDLRTNIETTNIKKVLDGDIEEFIEGYLNNN